MGGTFTNKADIFIGGNNFFGDIGIRNQAIFNNEAGGTLNNAQLNGVGGVVDNLANGYILNAGTFNNDKTCRI